LSGARLTRETLLENRGALSRRIKVRVSHMCLLPIAGAIVWLTTPTDRLSWLIPMKRLAVVKLTRLKRLVHDRMPKLVEGDAAHRSCGVTARG